MHFGHRIRGGSTVSKEEDKCRFICIPHFNGALEDMIKLAKLSVKNIVKKLYTTKKTFLLSLLVLKAY